MVIDLEQARLALKDGDVFQVKRSGHCGHYQKTVDRDKRAVTCRKCDAVLDPIAVLLDLAHGWERYAFAFDAAKQKTQQAHDRLDEVLRQERNAKARLRRLKGKLKTLER